MLAHVVVAPSRVTWMLRLELERPTAVLGCTHGARLKANNGGGAPAAVLPRKSPTHKNQNLPSEPKLKSEIAREKGAKKQDICDCSNDRSIDGTEFVRISEELASEASRALPLAGADGSCTF